MFPPRFPSCLRGEAGITYRISRPNTWRTGAIGSRVPNGFWSDLAGAAPQDQSPPDGSVARPYPRGGRADCGDPLTGPLRIHQGAAAGDSHSVTVADASSIPAWAESGVRSLLGDGLMTGFPNGSFEPDGISTRAQAAMVIARYLRFVGKV